MIKKISREEFLKMKDSEEKDIRVVDVLAEDHFEKEHIPGAVNIPVGKIEKYAEDKLGKDDLIVVYCANRDCQASPKAAGKLEDAGFKHIFDYEDGLADYKEAGLPLAGGAQG